MVRFARAEGSKGSNKRVLEEPTPWSQMVSQIGTPANSESAPKMKKKKLLKNADSDNDVVGHPKKKKKVKKNANTENIESVSPKKKKKVQKDVNAENSKSATPMKKKKKKLQKNAVAENNESVISKEKEKVQSVGSPCNEDSSSGAKQSKKGGKERFSDKSKLIVENDQKYQILDNGKKRPWFELPYEEGDRMTRYEGFWVKPDMVKKLNELRETLLETLDADMARKRMMKAKRKAHKELTRELIYDQKRLVTAELGDDAKKEEIDNHKDKSIKHENISDPSEKKAEDLEVEAVLYGGFWIMKEGAIRLNSLRADLARKGVSKMQQRAIIKSERRKEEKLLRRERKRVCLRCRKRGHMVNDCPEIVGLYGGEQTNTGICYGCGSTEHRVGDCPQAGKEEEYPHATCFVCRRVGHISKQCPDNPRGLYPNGGSCRGCGSVDHLAANCTVLQVEQAQATIKLGRIDGGAVESLDVELPVDPVLTKSSTFKKKAPKVIIFS